MKVLIADNAEDTKSVLGGILLGKDYECVFVENNADIIEKVYTEVPDIVILDTKPAGPSGLEILKKLKSAPSTRDIPVVLIASKKSQSKLAKGYELGAYDYISRPYFKEELTARLSNITFACERVKELEKLLDRDYLTGIYNRRFFMERFHEELSWSSRHSEPISLMMLDIDHFKKINDTYGHGCGDEILKQIANTMTAVLRIEDVVARYGGEEFIILLPNTDSEGVLTAAEKLRAAVHDKDFSCENGSTRIQVTVSIGVTAYAPDNECIYLPPDRVIGQADTALYTAKEQGRNRVVAHKQ
ncbi:MAG TPA: diguanylate cyclase response regulator [Nitrospiraceae bacterium]|nr:MAG: hypothetical protein A2Z82_09285 [Nitrospirae bacterium GWA2_46_11]OGW24989.1 MAG: hypothetical protein A2X55_05960 [Nitrospirae bacterium GWB2_47_37]HAK88781.1 diguanylate cyclase response regulator [Nitrospiraceae bacterium]HCZ11506.1 diguanylate cyclase response regulator [Nitrospiraceae bacterium]